jgi:putative transposase
MLAERGLDVSYETIRRWFLKFGSVIAANLRRTRPRPSDHWHLDEMVIVIRRKRYWLSAKSYGNAPRHYPRTT